MKQRAPFGPAVQPVESCATVGGAVGGGDIRPVVIGISRFSEQSPENRCLDHSTSQVIRRLLLDSFL